MAKPLLQLGQIFYGRSRDGYGILGASPSGRPFADAVEALCRAVGSPDRPGDVRPFLLSKRERGHVIMVRACRDEDPTGRATLFFHALVAPEDELAAAGLDAFVLSDRKAFVSSPPAGGVEDLRFSDSGKRSSAPRSADVDFPAFVASDHPLDAEVRRILGIETLTRNWSTYSYNPLPGFDFCVCSSYAAAPAGGNRYAFDGGRFCPLANVAASAVQSKGTSSIANRPSSPMLKFSLLANAVLAVALIVALSLRESKPEVPAPQPADPVTPPMVDSAKEEDDAREKWESKWKKEWESSTAVKTAVNGNADLRKAFSRRLGGNSRILEFETSVAGLPNLEQMWKKGPDNANKKFLLSCQAYVDFVEEEIFTNKPSN